MFETPTTLILGAGASAHVGYPVGSKLLSDICGEVGRDAVNSCPDLWNPSDISAFINRLSRSAHWSIDAFLGTLSSDNEFQIGKYLIAYTLKKCERIDNLFLPRSAGWYQLLFNEMLVEGKPEFERNRLRIITFNYDRSLEAYLFEVLKARFEISDSECLDRLKQVSILHVHGIMGSFPECPYSSSTHFTEVLEASEGIKIIHEFQDNEDGFASSEFETANQWLRESERIYFLGFGFHEENVKRFRFFDPENVKGKEMFATLAGFGNSSLNSMFQRMEKFGITANSLKHTFHQVNDFFEHGHPLNF